MPHFPKFYNPSENLAIDEVIVSFKGRVIFKQYVPNNASVTASKFSNFFYSTGYTLKNMF